MSSNTAVILIGNESCFFKPMIHGIHSATISEREELSTCLESEVEASSLESLHIVMQAMSVSTLFDPTAVSSLVPFLCPNAKVMIHIIGHPGEEDVDTVRVALVLANLNITSEEEVMGGTIVTAKSLQ